MSSPNTPTSSVELPDHLSQREAIVIATDITSFARLAEEIADDRRTALYLDGFYDLCGKHLQSSGGQIIKFIGDSCLAIYPGESAVDAVDAVSRLQGAYLDYRNGHGFRIGELRSALHVGEVVIGSYGPLGHLDIIGRAVNTTFMSIQGAGITITESLYRKLPSGRRSPWHKRTGPTVYTMH